MRVLSAIHATATMVLLLAATSPVLSLTVSLSTSDLPSVCPPSSLHTRGTTTLRFITTIFPASTTSTVTVQPVVTASSVYTSTYPTQPGFGYYTTVSSTIVTATATTTLTIKTVRYGPLVTVVPSSCTFTPIKSESQYSDRYISSTSTVTESVASTNYVSSGPASTYTSTAYALPTLTLPGTQTTTTTVTVTTTSTTVMPTKTNYLACQSNNVVSKLPNGVGASILDFGGGAGVPYKETWTEAYGEPAECCAQCQRLSHCLFSVHYPSFHQQGQLDCDLIYSDASTGNFCNSSTPIASFYGYANSDAFFTLSNGNCGQVVPDLSFHS